jgi:hypothetical protein
MIPPRVPGHLRAGSRVLAAAAALTASLASPLAAQAFTGGAVLRLAGGDSIPVPGVKVVLHRIGRELQGPIDSAATDRRGRFRFRFTSDTGAVYLVSARWSDIEYFSTPVHLNLDRPDSALHIVVADTSSTAPIELEARHLVVAPPGPEGSRGILDLIVLRNAGQRTRVAPDTVRPTWSGALPSGTLGLEIGAGEFSDSSVARRGDRLLFFAPFPPGEKQIVAEYLVPAGARETRLPFDQPAALLNVLVAESGADVSGPGIAFADTQVIEGRSYRRFTGSVAAGSTIRIGFPGAGLASRWVLPALVAVVAGALILAGVWAALREPALAGAAPNAGAAAVDGLVTRIATLDARYHGREAVTPPDEWRRYQDERARLKAELAAALEAGPP